METFQKNARQLMPADLPLLSDGRSAAKVLGMARGAGAVRAGTGLVIDTVRKGKAAAVFVAADVSANTMKKITDKCSFYKVPLYSAGITLCELADAIGLDRPTAVAAVTNAEFLNIGRSV